MKTCEKINVTNKIKSIKPEIRYLYFVHCFKVSPVEDMFPAEFSESSAEKEATSFAIIWKDKYKYICCVVVVGLVFQ